MVSPEGSKRSRGRGIQSDEMLVFQTIQTRTGPLSIDLFAAAEFLQLETGPGGCDAFLQNWSTIPGRLYANPPWSRAKQYRKWDPSGKQYPILLSHLLPYLISQSQDLIQPTSPQTIEPQLAVWANDFLTKKFLDKSYDSLFNKWCDQRSISDLFQDLYRVQCWPTPLN